MNASVPEPPPKPNGQIVPTVLCNFIDDLKNFRLDPDYDDMRNEYLTKLSNLVQERNAFGMKKYGQPLYSEDGRNGIEDARQELGDLLQYVCKISLQSDYNQEEREELLNLIKTAVVVITALLE
ncbi:MAG: hypothetical protein K2Q45_00520 [Nitrosomonas sp.]|nr:hypothetical protein [Nitrosomonas sp.]